jgi:hypothetical protein
VLEIAVTVELVGLEIVIVVIPTISLNGIILFVSLSL